MHGGFRVIATSPGSIGEGVGGHIFDDGIENHAITSRGDEGRVGFKFGENMIVRVHGIETDQNFPVFLAMPRTCSITFGSMEEPSIIWMRLNIGWASIASRLCGRISISIPKTFRSVRLGFIISFPVAIASAISRSASIEALKMSDPPWAIPVSMIRSGFTCQMISCIATMSWGYWMMGRPSHENYRNTWAKSNQA